MTTSRARREPIPSPRQYSAEDVRSDSADRGKVYTDGIRTRVDQTVGGMTTIVISRPDLGVMYRIEADTQTYCTIRLGPEIEGMPEIDMDEATEWEYVATQPFGSRTVDIFDVFGKGEVDRRSRVYVDRETHIRWKEVVFNRFGKEVLVIETKNVEIGPPPAYVFDLPPGLREIPLP